GRTATEHHAVDLRLLVLQDEIEVSGAGRLEIADLAADPHEGEAPLDQVAGAAQQPRDAEDVIPRRIFRGQVEFHGAVGVRIRGYFNPHCRALSGVGL